MSAKEAAQSTINFGSKVVNVLKAGLLTTSGLGLAGAGAWVAYKDAVRWSNMETVFSQGYVAPPMDEDLSQVI